MPIIPVTISYGAKKFNVEALIDSGANICFCRQEFIHELGIKPEKCRKISVTGVGGSAAVLVHKLVVELEYGKFKFLADVGFGSFVFHGFAFILGQKDFFENVNIFFERRKERIDLHLPK